jgi:hypothetical protein
MIDNHTSLRRERILNADLRKFWKPSTMRGTSRADRSAYRPDSFLFKKEMKIEMSEREFARMGGGGVESEIR